MSRFRIVLSAVALALFAAACGGAGAADSQSAAPIEPAVSPLNGTFTTLTGGQIDLESLQDQDVVLWFWAPW